MQRKYFHTLLFVSFLFSSLIVSAQKSVVTQHTDDNRTGWYKEEVQLNQKNVRAGSFGKLFTRYADDQMYAQPLVKCNLNIPGIGKRNVVFLATVNNTVYAYDADSANISAPYWQRNLNPAKMRTINIKDIPASCFGIYHDFTYNMGIVGTPVIDTVTNIMYLVARSIDSTTKEFFQYLHAMNITTGAEVNGSPVLITDTIAGIGAGSVGGLLGFNAKHQNQRPGLLLLNGVVYIAWASHCDWGPYHGWVIGYDKNTLEKKYTYNTTPDGFNGGIWMTGGGPAADEEGNLYVGVGNGSVGAGGDPGNIRNRSETVLQLTPSGDTLKVSSFFTPTNFQQLEASDLDLGVSQVMLLPGKNLAMECVKDGHIYVMDKDNLGGYNASGNAVVQTIDLGKSASLRSSLAYYGGGSKGYAYSWSGNSVLNQYPFDYGLNRFDLSNITSSGVQGPSGSVGAFMAVSSNGSLDSTAVLWTSYPATGDANSSVRPGILRAFDATDVTKELWNSSIYYEDNPGNFAKFNCPTICNGKVYLPTFSNQLTVFGLTGNKADTCSTNNIALHKPAVASSDSGGIYTASSAFDEDASTKWLSAAADPQFIYVDLGTKSSLCRAALHWGNDNARDFKLQVSDDAITWADVASVTNNIITDNYIPVNASARYIRMYATKRGDKKLGYSLTEFEVFGTKLAVSCEPPAELYADNIVADAATLHWTSNNAEHDFRAEYKTISASSWNQIMTNDDSIVLHGLACGTSYLFRVQAICSTSDSSDFSSSSAFTTLSCNGNCNPLPTRWYTEDIGNTALAGEACYNDAIFAMRGAGNDINGTEDAFRFAYKTLVGDGDITARILDQTESDKLSKCGIMIRESLSPDSRHAFIALAVDSGAVFESRNNTSGNTNSIFSDNKIKAPYWLKLNITGSTGSAYVSDDNITWTQLGTATELGFGNGLPVYSGFAVTSADNTILTTAHADNFSLSGALPLQLLSFTANLDLNKTVLLQWKTSLETNTKYFAVERSSDNRTFREISRVNAANSGRFTVTYQTTDAHPGNGINYYRLRMVDADNSITYSSMVVIRVSNSKAPLLYPNPASGSLNVAQGDEAIKLVNLYDVAGRLLYSVPNISEMNTINIPVSSYSNGIYFVEIRTANTVFMEKVLVRN